MPCNPTLRAIGKTTKSARNSPWASTTLHRAGDRRLRPPVRSAELPCRCRGGQGLDVRRHHRLGLAYRFQDDAAVRRQLRRPAHGAGLARPRRAALAEAGAAGRHADRLGRVRGQGAVQEQADHGRHPRALGRHQPEGRAGDDHQGHQHGAAEALNETARSEGPRPCRGHGRRHRCGRGAVREARLPGAAARLPHEARHGQPPDDLRHATISRSWASSRTRRSMPSAANG